MSGAEEWMVRAGPSGSPFERIGILTDETHQREIESRVLEHLGIAFEAEDLPHGVEG